MPDAGRPDAGLVHDAGVANDAGLDAGAVHDAGAPDAGGLDAGAPVDGGAVADPDGGVTRVEGGGCGCQSLGAGGLLAALALAALARRRR